MSVRIGDQALQYNYKQKSPCNHYRLQGVYIVAMYLYYLLKAVATSTAQATVHPTIGLLPIPRNPIIST